MEETARYNNGLIEDKLHEECGIFGILDQIIIDMILHEQRISGYLRYNIGDRKVQVSQYPMEKIY